MLTIPEMQVRLAEIQSWTQEQFDAKVTEVLGGLDPVAVDKAYPNGCGKDDCPRHGNFDFNARTFEPCLYPEWKAANQLAMAEAWKAKR